MVMRMDQTPLALPSAREVRRGQHILCSTSLPCISPDLRVGLILPGLVYTFNLLTPSLLVDCIAIKWTVANGSQVAE